MEHWIKRATALVVIAVTAFAFTASYAHIYVLGLDHAQFGTAARLLPLSVDGAIISATLAMLWYSQHKLDIPAWPRAMLLTGVVATIAANVAYGLPYGWLAAVVSAWPALAFVGSVEVGVQLIRSSAELAAKEKKSKKTATEYAKAVTSGKVPTIREIMLANKVGQRAAQRLQRELRGSYA